MTTRSILLTLPFLTALATPSPAADDPLLKIVPPRDGVSICFERRYDMGVARPPLTALQIVFEIAVSSGHSL